MAETANRQSVAPEILSNPPAPDPEFISELSRIYRVPEPTTPHHVIGGRFWNLTLAIVLASIGAWVYRAPIADALMDEAPVAGRVSADMVTSFASLLNGSISEREASRERAAQRQGALQAQKAKDAQGAAKSAVMGPKAPTSPSGSVPLGASGSQAGSSSQGSVKAASVASGKGTPTTSTLPKRNKPAQVVLPPVQAPSRTAVIDPGSKYFGVALPEVPFNMKPVEAYSAAVGKRPNLVSGYQTWNDAFKPAMVEEAWRRGALPMITWEPMFKGSTAQPRLAEITAGNYDSLIDTYAAAVRDSKHPVGIRFAHEMNGRWYPWSEGYFGNKPGEFVEAWRHVHDRFEAIGATNAVWIWSPNVVGSNRTLPLSQIYPGDDYVDWASLSGYYRVDTGKTPSFKGTFSETLKAIRAVTERPILLGEIGVGTTVENRVTWLNSVFEGIAASPDIIGFVYFEMDKSAKVDSQDWRVEIDPAVTSAFANGVASPIYGAGTPAPTPAAG